MITLVQESCGIATAHIWGEWRRSGGGGACPTPFVPISLGEGVEGEGEKGKKRKKGEKRALLEWRVGLLLFHIAFKSNLICPETTKASISVTIKIISLSKEMIYSLLD